MKKSQTARKTTKNARKVVGFQPKNPAQKKQCACHCEYCNGESGSIARQALIIMGANRYGQIKINRDHSFNIVLSDLTFDQGLAIADCHRQPPTAKKSTVAFNSDRSLVQLCIYQISGDDLLKIARVLAEID